MNTLLKSTLAIVTTTSLIMAPIIEAEPSKHRHNQTQMDYARVINVSPIYETVSYSEPYQECHYEERLIKDKRDSTTAIIVGSLIGGAIGNELGHNKSNKRVGAFAGAVLGGSIARDIDRRKQGGYKVKTEKVCSTRYKDAYHEELTGYDVTYQYRNLTYYTTMDEHPGKRIRVAVNVQPLL